MPGADIAISVRNLTKTYRLFAHPGDRIKQAATFGLRKYHKEFTALKDVSFDIKKGETVGIIGRNGSGKSTLLQLICGILKPTSGSVAVNGRVSALLELGAGFNPEFTGRENVYFQGALMGLTTAQMEEKFDEIAAFADIGEFIDQPVRMYSSGMFVRLAFAVAINVAPEILVVDEALSVGDEGFQRKCYSRINAVRGSGGTVIFVSHSAAAVIELCERVILLDAGEALACGPPKPVLDQYVKLLGAPPGKAAQVAAAIRATGGKGTDTLSGDSGGAPPSMVSYESRGAVIGNPAIVDAEGRHAILLAPGQRYFYRYEVRFSKDARQVRFAMMIKTKSGYELGGMTSHAPGSGIAQIVGGTCVTVEFPFYCALLPGHYFLNAGVLGIENGDEVFLHRVLDIATFKVRPEAGTQAGGVIDFSVPDAQVRIFPAISSVSLND